MKSHTEAKGTVIITDVTRHSYKYHTVVLICHHILSDDTLEYKQHSAPFLILLKESVNFLLIFKDSNQIQLNSDYSVESGEL